MAGGFTALLLPLTGMHFFHGLPYFVQLELSKTALKKELIF